MQLYSRKKVKLDKTKWSKTEVERVVRRRRGQPLDQWSLFRRKILSMLGKKPLLKIVASKRVS